MDTVIVDSFTSVPFAGNPAGVCLPDAPLADAVMQQVAAELGLSETAFVRPLGQPGAFSIRYFSPKMEIPLCGHATLASAAVLFDRGASSPIRFTTVEGLDLDIRREGDRIAMDLPAYATRPAEAPAALLDALGLTAVENVAVNEETRILLLEIADPRVLAALAPAADALLRSHQGVNGVLVTAPGDDGYDVHSRYFWPWSGTLEDPVTGGTHTFLAPYWAERLGTTRLRSFQSSARTGSMEVELTGDGVRIRGQAVIVFEGRLRAALGEGA